MRYHSNSNIEEFSNYVSLMDREYTESIYLATRVYLDLEKYIFGDNGTWTFANHQLSLRDLVERFNMLLQVFDEIDAKAREPKQYRFLSIDLLDLSSASNREINFSFYLHIIKNHMFFDQILFADIHPQLRSSDGVDRAEEKYLRKSILEHNAQAIARVVSWGQANPLLNLVREFRQETILNERELLRGEGAMGDFMTSPRLYGHIVSNAHKIDPALLMSVSEIFSYLSIEESDLAETDFVLMINDLDLLSLIPELETAKPVFVLDLSKESSPNFPYLLLKDEGFSQVYSFARQRANEKVHNTISRSLGAGLMSLLVRRRFVEQLAINYMDDYFAPLAKSLGKSLKDFIGPINLLTTKLEEH